MYTWFHTPAQHSIACGGDVLKFLELQEENISGFPKIPLKVVSETMEKCVPAGMTSREIPAHKIRPKTTTPSFKCTLCDYGSDDSSNFKRHKMKHNPFNCPYCNFKTISRRNFDDHQGI
ncbi:unnamed protein product [Allacma fusca]|uniref:C2H2-type domain-containing protein n=1 Tax=Allacma fusca TaxID=39272 RepID=A0A8J2JN14_9HEXA|nr:unnamed protein product [Allacma fusca]